MNWRRLRRNGEKEESSASPEGEEPALRTITLSFPKEVEDLILERYKSIEFLKDAVPPGKYQAQIQGKEVLVTVSAPYTLEQITKSVGGKRRLLHTLGFKIIALDKKKKKGQKSEEVEKEKKLVLGAWLGKGYEASEEEASIAVSVLTGIPEPTEDAPAVKVQVMHFQPPLPWAEQEKKDAVAVLRRAVEGEMLVLPSPQGKPDLYILPITPPQLWSYIQANLMYLSDADEVIDIIASSSSYLDAANTLRETFRLDGYVRGKTQPYQDPKEVEKQTRTLIYLRVNWLPEAGLSWEDLRSQQVAKGLGWGLPKNSKLNYGIYNACFGVPGSSQAITACFGGAAPAMGTASSLSDLFVRWDKSRKGGTVPGAYMFRRGNGALYALVVAGKFEFENSLSKAYFPNESSEEGNRGSRPQYVDNIPVYQAMVQAVVLGADGPLSVCLLLPKPFEKKDDTGQSGYKAFTLQMTAYPHLEEVQLDLLRRSRGSRFVGPAAPSEIGRSSDIRAKTERFQEAERQANVALYYFRDNPPSFVEELCDRVKFFGNDTELLSWPAMFLGSLVGYFKPGWLDNLYSRQDVQEAITKAELRLYDFVVDSQEENAEKLLRIKLRQLTQVPKRKRPEQVEGEEPAAEEEKKLNLGDIPYTDLAEVSFVQDLAGYPSLPEAISLAPLVPGKITVYRSRVDALGNRTVGVHQTQFLIPQTSWDLYTALADGKMKVPLEPGEKLPALLPMVMATVGLYQTSVVRPNMGKRYREALTLLENQGEKLKGLGSDWTLAVPAAWINTAPPGEPENPRFYAYSCGKAKIKDVAQYLLRVKVTNRPDGGYGLQAASSDWRNPAPYLLDRLPCSSAQEKEEAKKQKRFPVHDAIAKIGTKEYREAVLSAFSDSRTPPKVSGGKMAVHVGMVGGGGTARGSSRPRDASPALRSQYKDKGLYLLANRSLSLRASHPYRDIGPRAEGMVFFYSKGGKADLVNLAEFHEREPSVQVSKADREAAQALVLRQFSDGKVQVIAPESLSGYQAFAADSSEARAVKTRFGGYDLEKVQVKSRGGVASLQAVMRENWQDLLRYMNFYRRLEDPSASHLTAKTPTPLDEENPSKASIHLEIEALHALQKWSSGQLGKDFTNAYWDVFLAEINSRRAQVGAQPYPEGTPSPFERGSLTEGDPALVEAAVAAVQDSDFGKGGSGKTLFGNAVLVRPDSMRPWTEGDYDRQYLPKDYADYIDEETLSAIRAIDNGQRGRRHRRPRRLRRGEARTNPLTKEEAAYMAKWAETRRADDEQNARLSFSERTDLDPHAQEGDYAAGIQEFFPQKTYKKPVPSARVLSPKVRFDALTSRDVIRTFDKPTHPSEAVAARLLQDLQDRKDVLGDEASRGYVAGAAELSAQEALQLHTIRFKNKVSGHVVSPSGAHCRLYRNASRLKGYTPPADVLSPKTCWIVVAPATKEHPARIMSYRNGAHVDCDMVSRRPQDLGLSLAKAIEGMILWLAEKGTRITSIFSVNLAQIGTSSYRVLWSKNVRSNLNVATLMEAAYRGPAEQGNWDGAKDWSNYTRALGASEVFQGAPKVFSSQAEAQAETRAVAKEVKGGLSSLPSYELDEEEEEDLGQR